jgi:hypothetical protein
MTTVARTPSSVTFSIVIATAGRRSITQTLAAITPQLEHGDEILIERLDCDWGGKARRNAIPRCAGTHLLFIDDDDHHTEGALEHIREKVGRSPHQVHLFAMAYDDGRVVEPTWPLRIGSVGTPMFCVPNVPGCIGEWSDRYECDYDFIDSTMTLRGDQPALDDHVIAAVSAPRKGF